MIRLKVDMQAIEAMLYYWEATRDREKVNERFLNEVANMPAMTLCYDEGFDAESVRKVLSAITNREPLSPANRKEGRFFNNNLWMLEDLSLTREMAQPVKVLNLDDVATELSEKYAGDREITVYFAPLHLEQSYSKGDSLALNFFSIQPDFAGGATFGGIPLREAIISRLSEMLTV